MAKKEKNGSQNTRLQAIVLVTAILNLVRAIVEIIHKLLE